MSDPDALHTLSGETAHGIDGQSHRIIVDLDNFLASCRLRHYERGETIILQGMYRRHCFIWSAAGYP